MVQYYTSSFAAHASKAQAGTQPQLPRQEAPIPDDMHYSLHYSPRALGDTSYGLEPEVQPQFPGSSPAYPLQAPPEWQDSPRSRASSYGPSSWAPTSSPSPSRTVPRPVRWSSDAWAESWGSKAISEPAPLAPVSHQATKPWHDTDGRVKPLLSLTNQEMQEYFSPILLEEAAPYMGTGDLLLFYGSEDPMNKMMREYQGDSWYNHVALVVRDPPDELLQAYNRSRVPDNLYTFEISILGRGGAGFRGLRLHMKAYREYAKVSTFVFWRKLVTPPGVSSSARDHPGLVRVLLEAKNRPSQMDYLKILQGRQERRQDDLSALFCSQAVAWALREMGVLHPNIVPSHYFPVDFSALLRPEVLPGIQVQGEYLPERQLLV